MRKSLAISCFAAALALLPLAPSFAENGRGGGSGGNGGSGSGGSGSGSGGSGSAGGPDGGGGSASSGGSGKTGGISSWGPDGGNSVSGERRQSDQDRAREAVARGSALSLGKVVPTVHAAAPGKILDVGLDRAAGGGWVYAFTVLGEDGRYRSVTVDAQRNRILEIRQR